ncbi:MAG: ATP-binding protein [Gemmatimonas sp.]
MLSVRARLTVWNGATIAVMLVGFSLAAYLLLRHGTLEQVDQTVRQQLRTITLAAESQGVASSADSTAVAQLAQELRTRGFDVATGADEHLLVTRSGRAEHADVRTDDPEDKNSRTRSVIAPGLLAFIEQHQSATTVAENASRAELFSAPNDDGGFRVAMRRIAFAGQSIRIAAIEPLDEVQELLGQAQATILIAIPLLVAAALGVGYLQARNALAPVAAMTRQAKQIGSKNLHERLPVAHSHDELGELAITFNDVLDRVDRAMEQQRQFTADASHELRTPVAIIRSEADVTLDATTATSDEYREALQVIRGGSEQLSRIVNDMFLLARADAGQALPRKVPLYINDLVNDTVRSMRALAARHDITIDAVAGDELPHVGDEELLKRALVNLLDNAVKYSPANSTIVVTAAAQGGATRISVTDSGPGIPVAARNLVFDRFYRVSSARSSDVSAHGSGAGLGLAIAREIVEMHGGTLTLNANSSNTPATTFTITLPHP